VVGSEIAQLLDSLADRFCARRALYCLFRFLPAYFAPNGLTDGWEDCRKALADTQALCGDQMTPDEAEDVLKAIVLVDRMLSQR
jgi:hypothetical protein